MDAIEQRDVLRTRTAEGERHTLSERVRALRLPHASARDGSGGRWLPWTLCLLLAGSTAVFGYLAFGRAHVGDDPAAVSSKGTQPDGEKGRSPASPPEGGIVLESKGYIIPAQQILVSPKVSGMVVKLPIEEGQVVREGDVLAQLETDDYQADVNRATASLEAAKQHRAELENYLPDEIKQAEAELAEAETQRDQLEANWNRTKALYEKRLISQEEYQAAQSQYLMVELRVKRLEAACKLLKDGPRPERRLAAEAEIEQAKAELAKAAWRLKNCTILAPISGTILKKNAEEGNIVNPVAFNGSFSLCEMADLSNLEVELSIQERDISKVFRHQKCQVRAEAFPDRVYEGRVDRVMPIADRAKGAIPVRVKVRVPPEEEGIYLKPEMGAIVTFYNEKLDNAAWSRVAQPKEEKGS